MPVLGSEFYNYLVSGFTNNTLSAQEVLLVDVIKPTALYFTISQFLTFNTYPVKNIGSQKSRTDYSNHADDSNLKVLPYQKNEIDGLAGFYLSQLQLFLKDNKALYPQYTNPSNYDDGISPSTTQNYSFGIIIPPSNNCSRY
jgi:DNA replication protein DnaD